MQAGFCAVFAHVSSCYSTLLTHVFFHVSTIDSKLQKRHVAFRLDWKSGTTSFPLLFLLPFVSESDPAATSEIDRPSKSHCFGKRAWNVLFSVALFPILQPFRLVLVIFSAIVRERIIVNRFLFSECYLLPSTQVFVLTPASCFPSTARYRRYHRPSCLALGCAVLLVLSYFAVAAAGFFGVSRLYRWHSQVGLHVCQWNAFMLNAFRSDVSIVSLRII